MPELSDIEALLARLAAIDFSQSSEQATREMAVNPVIGALGWDTFNPDEVAREYSVLGGRVDYCLRGHARNLVLIEVKRAGTDLSEHQEQLLRYAFDEGVPLAVLTDGLVWWLYLPMARASWEQRRFFRIDFREQDAADAASAIHRFLNRDGLISGTALEEAQREFESQERDRRLRVALQEAWRRVLADPQGLLRDLLAETVQEISGHFPDQELVTEFLWGITGSESTKGELSAPPPRRRRAALVAHGVHNHRAKSEYVPSLGNQERATAVPVTKSSPRTRSPSVPPAAFWLDGNRYEVKNWRMMLVRLCEQLAKEVGPVFAKRVAELRGRKRPYFSSSHAELRNPLQVPGADLYVEGNISSGSAERVARLTLHTVRDSDDGFRVELAGQAIPASKRTTLGKTAAPPVPANLKGRRPAAYWLHESRYEAIRWNEVLRGTCDQLAKEAGADFGERVVALRGRTRPYFSEDPDRLHQPLRLMNSVLYVEGNFSANGCVRLARRVLMAVCASDAGFRVELANPI